MGSRHRPAVYTIPVHRGFADALVAGLLDRFLDAERGLADGLILIPNNRAGRAITEAFVRRAEPGLLLPRMVPIGDLELGERLGSLLDPIGAGPDFPPAVAPELRQMLLARLVAARRPGLSATEALRLARDLGRVIDQLAVEEIDADRLLALRAEAEGLSEHWQRAFDLLAPLTADWPAMLAARGEIDAAARRNLLLRHAARRWREAPPPGFVCVAGVATAAPAVAVLLRTIAEMPKGMVVLPHFDAGLSSDEWALIGPHRSDPADPHAPVPPAIETHPQFHLKLLLDRMAIGPGEVIVWRRSGESDAAPQRSRAVRHAFAPPELTEQWVDLPAEQRRLPGVRLVTAADSAEEAQAIALLVREALETPEKRVALVTPDRTLAGRVAAHLSRWGIEADDSAGKPLVTTPPGALLRLLAEALAADFAPVALLALLKHPLVRAGEGRPEWLAQARALDRALRGPRPAPGLAGVMAHLEGASAGLRDWSDGVAALLAPLGGLAEAAPAEAFALLVDTAARLSGDAVWQGPSGRELARLAESLAEALPHGPDRVLRAELPELIAELLDGATVRPPWGGHPRVAIYGLLEARLQQPDLVICGGLNEGTWPGRPAPDPWLAPRIRRLLGLPHLDRGIGLAAHDLAGAMGAREVVLTRALRDADRPTVASRFLLRLQAMGGQGFATDPLAVERARALDAPAAVTPAAQPAPRPHAESRRVPISITEVDLLATDPYQFYARRILALAPLDPLDADPDARHRGTAVHDILESWSRHDGHDPAKLVARAQAMLDRFAAHPLTRTFWEPRLLAAIAWIAEETASLAATGRKVALVEASGTLELAPGVVLRGKIDRIDRLPDGSLVVLDYKTGHPPKPKQLAAGYALQLGLGALLVEQAGVRRKDDPAAPLLTGAVGALEYWSLARDGRRKEGEPHFGYRKPLDDGKAGRMAEHPVAFADEQLTDRIARWLTGDAPFTARRKPDYVVGHDFDRLMRFDEWWGRQCTQAGGDGELGA